MSSNSLICELCNTTTSSFFFVIGHKCICNDCKSSKKNVNKIQSQALPVFTRYICKTCSTPEQLVCTYNVNNMMFRHVMPDCEIISQDTLGIIRPATQGGLNGDISRTHFLGVNEMVRLKINLQNYTKFVYAKKKIKMSARMGRERGNYHDKKYYNKHLCFIRLDNDIDFHKYDELFAKIKFNLKVYNDSVHKVFEDRKLARVERQNMYYKNLVKDFMTQVIKV